MHARHQIFYPVLKRGFLPQPADVQRLSALVGTARAKLILMAGQRLTADEAQAIGLVEMVVERADFDAAIADLTADALAAKPQQVAAIKRLFGADLSASDLEDCYRAAYDNDADAIERISGKA